MSQAVLFDIGHKIEPSYHYSVSSDICWVHYTYNNFKVLTRVLQGKHKFSFPLIASITSSNSQFLVCLHSRIQQTLHVSQFTKTGRYLFASVTRNLGFSTLRCSSAEDIFFWWGFWLLLLLNSNFLFLSHFCGLQTFTAPFPCTFFSFCFIPTIFAYIGSYQGIFPSSVSYFSYLEFSQWHKQKNYLDFLSVTLNHPLPTHSPALQHMPKVHHKPRE